MNKVLVGKSEKECEEILKKSFKNLTYTMVEIFYMNLYGKRFLDLIKIKNKTASIVSFVEGKDKLKLNPKNCYEIGKNIAKFHKTSKKIKLYRKNSLSLKEWPKLLNKIGNKSKIKFN